MSQHLYTYAPAYAMPKYKPEPPRRLKRKGGNGNLRRAASAPKARKFPLKGEVRPVVVRSRSEGEITELMERVEMDFPVPVAREEIFSPFESARPSAKPARPALSVDTAVTYGPPVSAMSCWYPYKETEQEQSQNGDDYGLYTRGSSFQSSVHNPRNRSTPNPSPTTPAQSFIARELASERDFNRSRPHYSPPPPPSPPPSLFPSYTPPYPPSPSPPYLRTSADYI